jgi:L-ascorbate metabolism protein UlaG (beta-lactamase superfamily)
MFVTHLGGPTVLLEVAGWRILTDPTFDPPGRRYRFGWGTSSRKTVGPALTPEQLPPIDLVLLTHHQHADNLDDAGREFLHRQADSVITTPAGSRALGYTHVTGLNPWARQALMPLSRPRLTVTATPARHGPPLSKPIAGAVTGFVIESPDTEVPTIWITGDSVLYRGLRQVAASFDIDVLVMHLGGVGFPISGPLKYTMNGADGVQLAHLLDPQVIVPVHHEGWSHFRETRDALTAAFAQAPEDVRARVLWPGSGVRHPIATTSR